MKHKKITQYDIVKSIRRTWEFSPASRIKPSKKIYSRKNFKVNLD